MWTYNSVLTHKDKSHSSETTPDGMLSQLGTCLKTILSGGDGFLLKPYEDFVLLLNIIIIGFKGHIYI